MPRHEAFTICVPTNHVILAEREFEDMYLLLTFNKSNKRIMYCSVIACGDGFTIERDITESETIKETLASLVYTARKVELNLALQALEHSCVH